MCVYMCVHVYMCVYMYIYSTSTAIAGSHLTTGGTEITINCKTVDAHAQY